MMTAMSTAKAARIPTGFPTGTELPMRTMYTSGISDPDVCAISDSWSLPTEAESHKHRLWQPSNTLSKTWTGRTGTYIMPRLVPDALLWRGHRSRPGYCRPEYWLDLQYLRERALHCPFATQRTAAVLPMHMANAQTRPLGCVH